MPIDLTELESALQYVTTFLTGSGITALITALYERRQEAREAAREHFRQVVLTPEFFKYVYAIAEISLVVSALDEFTRTGKTSVVEHGKRITFRGHRGNDSLTRLMLRRGDRLNSTRWRFESTAAYFLMPNKTRESLTQLREMLNKLSAPITQQYLTEFREKFDSLEEVLTKTLGISGLH